MPPSLEATLAREKTPVFKQPLVQRRLVFGDGVISRSPERAAVSSNNAKGKRVVKPRMYGEGPLPFRPSDEAPRDARIVGRVAEPGKQPIYTLKVGDIEIDDINLHEILEYVSPYELEQYEHRQFEEEREAMNAALAAAAEEEERRRARHKERAKRKGIIQFEEVDDDDEADNNGSAQGTGRARPTYKHLFKVPQERRRRRKRDPATGELLPLSDEELREDTGMESSEDGQLPQGRAPGPAFGELQKRRRRKRDPVTGELLPLEPLPQSLPQKMEESHVRQSPVAARRSETPLIALEPKKRPRRRRHPLTNELMPLGWRYDPNAEQAAQESKRDGMSPSMRKLSISQEQQPKRLKLASESSADDISQQHPPFGSESKSSTRENPLFKVQPDVAIPDVSETDDLARNDKRYQATSPQDLKSPPKTSMMRPDVQQATFGSSAERITIASFLKGQQDESDSDEPLRSPQKSGVRNTPTQGRTSIMNPVAAKEPVTEDEDSDSDLDEGEWFVEAIVGHKLSDPRTHPGKPSVMLYHTKWERSEELTWEPADSFSDPSTVTDYRRRVGLDKGKQAIKSPVRVVPVVASSSMSMPTSKSDERKSVSAAQPSAIKANR